MFIELNGGQQLGQEHAVKQDVWVHFCHGAKAGFQDKRGLAESGGG